MSVWRVVSTDYQSKALRSKDGLQITISRATTDRISIVWLIGCLHDPQTSSITVAGSLLDVCWDV